MTDNVRQDVFQAVTRTRRQGKDGKGKAKAKDDKDKTDPKSNSNKDKKCFYCDKIGHVKADCRKKKRDDEERKTTLAQNSLTSSPTTSTPPGLANVPTSTSGGSASSLANSLSRLTSRMMNSTVQ